MKGEKSKRVVHFFGGPFQVEPRLGSPFIRNFPFLHIAALMPPAARCDFNDGLCGWSDPTETRFLLFDRFSSGPPGGTGFRWERRRGPTRLQGVRGDLSVHSRHNGERNPLQYKHPVPSPLPSFAS